MATSGLEAQQMLTHIRTEFVATTDDARRSPNSSQFWRVPDARRLKNPANPERP
jgi:hypothetical protein